MNWRKGCRINSSSIRGRKIHIEEVFIDVLVWQNLYSLPSATNHKLQEAGLQSGNYFCKDCTLQGLCPAELLGKLNPLSCSSFYHYTGSVTSQSVTSANMWVVLVNFWLGLAYHTEETSSYKDTGKIWSRSSHVRVNVHQEESMECLPLLLAAHFLPLDFISLSDRYLGNTSFQSWGFGCKGCSTTVSVVLNCEQDNHKWDNL